MKKIILLTCVLLLSGCSAKFAYNNVNWLIYWYLDDYVEFNNAQEDMFDDMLGSWMTWHKQEELPKYQAQLEDIMADIKANNVSEQSIASHRDRARQHWLRARSHVASDLVSLGATMSREQIIYFFAKLEKQNLEDEEEMNERSQLDEQERIEKWVKRNQKGIKKWTGKLSTEQKDFIETFNGRFESTGPFWLAYKREYQQQLREVFSMPTRDTAFEQSLYDLIKDPERFRSAEFQQAMDSNAQAGTEYMMGLMEMASAKQVVKLVDEIGELQKDVVNLQN
jgi:hypothetical protein